MRVIIIGENRAEFCRIASKDLDKRFFETRGQCYRIYPQELRRLKVYERDDLVEEDEVLVFREGSVVPYHAKNTESYRLDYILAELDQQKLMTPRGVFGEKGIFAHAFSDTWKRLLPYSGVIIAGIVVVYALLTQRGDGMEGKEKVFLSELSEYFAAGMLGAVATFCTARVMREAAEDGNYMAVAYIALTAASYVVVRMIGKHIETKYKTEATE